MNTTRPVSYVKAHLAEVIESVRESRDPVTITQNGSPSAVLVDHESYQRTRDALAILKLVAMGEHDVAMGRTVSQSRVFKDARARLKARLAEQDHQG
jgi:prevent-host-death family protein